FSFRPSPCPLLPRGEGRVRGTGLRYNEDAIALARRPSAGGGVGLGRDLLAGGTSPAACSQEQPYSAARPLFLCRFLLAFQLLHQLLVILARAQRGEVWV